MGVNSSLGSATHPAWDGSRRRSSDADSGGRDAIPPGGGGGPRGGQSLARRQPSGGRSGRGPAQCGAEPVRRREIQIVDLSLTPCPQRPGELHGRVGVGGEGEDRAPPQGRRTRPGDSGSSRAATPAARGMPQTVGRPWARRPTRCASPAGLRRGVRHPREGPPPQRSPVGMEDGGAARLACVRVQRPGESGDEARGGLSRRGASKGSPACSPSRRGKRLAPARGSPASSSVTARARSSTPSAAASSPEAARGVPPVVPTRASARGSADPPPRARGPGSAR